VKVRVLIANEKEAERTVLLSPLNALFIYMN